LIKSAARPLSLTVKDKWCQIPAGNLTDNSGVPAYEAVKPGLDGQPSVSCLCVRITNITEVVDTNGLGTSLPVNVVTSDLPAAVQLESEHEYKLSLSRLVKRNSVKMSVTSRKPPVPPPGDRIHEHDRGPCFWDLESNPGPSPIEPVLAVSTCGPSTHCDAGAAVQKKSGTKT